MPLLIFILIGVILVTGILCGSFYCKQICIAAVEQPLNCVIIASLLVIGDIAAVVIFLWALVIEPAGMAGFGIVMTFLGVILLGLTFAWKHGFLKKI